MRSQNADDSLVCDMTTSTYRLEDIHDLRQGFAALTSKQPTPSLAVSYVT